MQFDIWHTQFRAIATFCGWNNAEKALRLISSLEGQAAGLIVGLSDAQLNNYAFIIDKLKKRYEPEHREESYRIQFKSRCRRRMEEADEFADELASLARKAYPSVDQQFIDDLVMDRFRDGHTDSEMKKHLALTNATSLPQIISACVRYETATESAHPRKPYDGMNNTQECRPLVQDQHMTYAEVAARAKQLGYALRPWSDHNDSPRPSFHSRQHSFERRNNFDRRRQSDQRQSSGWRQQGSRRDYSQMTCWNCGGKGHTRWACKEKDTGMKFAPPGVMNTIQDSQYDACYEHSDTPHDSVANSTHEDDLN
jgi:hypothetical protein